MSSLESTRQSSHSDFITIWYARSPRLTSTFNKSQCYNAQSEILFVLSQGQPLCIHVGPRKGSLFQSILACQGITWIHRESNSFQLTNIVSYSFNYKNRREASLVWFSWPFVEVLQGKQISHSMGGSQGMQDGFTVCFQSPSALVSYGESVSVCLKAI